MTPGILLPSALVTWSRTVLFEAMRESEKLKFSAMARDWSGDEWH
jgi:hypothetical protein